MSETCGYLVPDKLFKVGDFTKQLRKILEDLEIIHGYYDEEEGSFAAGRKSFSIFSENINNQPIAFEYAQIHDTANKRLVPEAFGAGANCNNCKQNIDEAFAEALSDLYEGEYGNNVETDMTQLGVTCDHCGHVNVLPAIKFDYDTAIANQYFQFVNIETDFNAEVITEIGKKLGCNLKAFYDRY